MVIIIESVDKAGKTTLAEAVSKAFPGIMIKITDRPKDSSEFEKQKIKDHYETVLYFILNHRRINFILDRFFPSEMCYSIKRGYDAKNDPFFESIEKKMKELDHLFVFCHPGKETINERMDENPDDYVSKEENNQILKRYEDFFEKTTLNKLQVDTSKSIEELINEIKNYLNEHQRCEPDTRTQPTLF